MTNEAKIFLKGMLLGIVLFTIFLLMTCAVYDSQAVTTNARVWVPALDGGYYSIDMPIKLVWRRDGTFHIWDSSSEWENKG